MNDFYREIEKNDVVVIFGYAVVGEYIYRKIKTVFPDKTVFFCDNAKEKQGEHENEVVLSVEVAVKRFPDALYIVKSNFWQNEMEEQLNLLGIQSDFILNDLPDCFLEETKTLNANRVETPLKKAEFHFEVNIVDHCNLNCKGCNHFSPLVKEKFVSLENFEKDMARIAQLFDGRVASILLLGGEPLLHPDIEKFMKISRNCFPKADILLVTNGILLNKMKTSFWRCCREYKIKIAPTKYPIQIDYDDLERLAGNYGVQYAYFGNTETSGRTLWFNPLDLSGKQSMKQNFLSCLDANNCVALKDGKIYTCVVAPHADLFQEYFQQTFDEMELNGLDIYKVKTAEEILNFLTKEIPFCKYCDLKNRTYDNLWEVSKKSIKEWSL